VPEPYGFAVLRQTIFADGYRGATVVFGGVVRATDVADQAGLFLRVGRGPVRGRRNDPDNHLAAVTSSTGWVRHEVTAEVPDEDSLIIHFGAFLIGRGQVELRDAGLEGPALYLSS
jgi:hypothetical protein